jgi:hypothetical protein
LAWITAAILAQNIVLTVARRSTKKRGKENDFWLRAITLTGAEWIVVLAVGVVVLAVNKIVIGDPGSWGPTVILNGAWLGLIPVWLLRWRLRNRVRKQVRFRARLPLPGG